jgi:protocatechuate 3,4-dioxygenase, alpha subunit
VALRPTASQTVGPFFIIGMPDEARSTLVSPSDPDAVRLGGVVLDGAGDPVDDALIEIWQANRAGRYAHPEDVREELPLDDGFEGFGRCATGPDGAYAFVTVKPGPVPAPDGSMQAPHIMLSVFARGLLKRLATRVYFPDETEANDADPVLASIEDPAERGTLVARQEDGRLRFDIRLQGDRQTAFFNV